MSRNIFQANVWEGEDHFIQVKLAEGCFKFSQVHQEIDAGLVVAKRGTNVIQQDPVNVELHSTRCVLYLGGIRGSYKCVNDVLVIEHGITALTVNICPQVLQLNVIDHHFAAYKFQ